MRGLGGGILSIQSSLVWYKIQIKVWNIYYLESPDAAMEDSDESENSEDDSSEEEAAMEDSDESDNSEDDSSEKEESAKNKAGSSGWILYTIFVLLFVWI